MPAPAPARTPPAAWAPPRLPHACWSDPARLTRAIRGARGGVLILTGAPRAAPFASIASLFDSVTPDIAARANAAYGGGGMGGAGGGARLVWKDAYGEGRWAARAGCDPAAFAWLGPGAGGRLGGARPRAAAEPCPLRSSNGAARRAAAPGLRWLVPSVVKPHHYIIVFAGAAPTLTPSV